MLETVTITIKCFISFVKLALEWHSHIDLKSISINPKLDIPLKSRFCVEITQVFKNLEIGYVRDLTPDGGMGTWVI
jgi:hypothetical protein